MAMLNSTTQIIFIVTGIRNSLIRQVKVRKVIQFTFHCRQYLASLVGPKAHTCDKNFNRSSGTGWRSIAIILSLNSRLSIIYRQQFYAYITDLPLATQSLLPAKLSRHKQCAVFHTMSFPAFSSPAFPTSAVWCRIVRSRIFSVPRPTWHHHHYHHY